MKATATIPELAAARGPEHAARLAEHVELLRQRVGARGRPDLCERCKCIRDQIVCVNCEQSLCRDCVAERTCDCSVSQEHVPL